jgi:hypothetical protein
VSSFVSLALLVGGIVLVVAGAELFYDGLLAAGARFGVSAFLLTVVVSGFELENLAAGIAANAKGLPDAAAGTFLGGTTFLALAVAGLGAVLAPLRAQELDKLRRLSYSDLRDRFLNQQESFELPGPSGGSYQIELQAFWDDKRGGNLRVMGCIDDGGWRAFAPLGDSFIVAPDGSFVGD